MSTEAMKLALKALEGIHPGNMTPMAEEYWNKAITALREALAESALERMAENARELGLDYEQPSPQCKWPTCQSEEYQQALAEQIKRELVGEQPPQTDWEAIAADQAMTIAMLDAELQEFAERQADAVEVALTESGWVWDGDQWQRPPQTWIELDHDDIHALLNEFFIKGCSPLVCILQTLPEPLKPNSRRRTHEPLQDL